MWVLLLLALTGCARMTYHPPDVIQGKDPPAVIKSDVPVEKSGGS